MLTASWNDRIPPGNATVHIFKPAGIALQENLYQPVLSGAALSENTVSAFLSHLGEDRTKRRAFYQKRADRVIAEHHIAIDGMLKQDNSSVNDLSAFSRKARVRGCREASGSLCL